MFLLLASCGGVKPAGHATPCSVIAGPETFGQRPVRFKGVLITDGIHETYALPNGACKTNEIVRIRRELTPEGPKGEALLVDLIASYQRSTKERPLGVLADLDVVVGTDPGDPRPVYIDVIDVHSTKIVDLHNRD